MSNTATLLLDGNPLVFTPGDSIMQAAARAGHYIPHLCYHPQLGAHGSCRVCSVKVNGRLMASCTTPAEAGMVVENLSDAIQHLRRRLVQMLFVEGNHFCPSCERSGNCQLQAVAYFVGMQDSHFAHLYPQRELDASHPEILLDHDRCIQCELCVRASRELDGKHSFALAGRGGKTQLVVDAPSGLLKDSTLTTSDRAAHVCPVGAILIKRQGYTRPIGERLYDQATIACVGHHQPDEA